MDSIATQIRSLAQTADEAGRLEIQRSLREIQLEMQNPTDVIMEIGNFSTLIGVVRVGADLGLFRHLASHDGSLTVDQMAGLTAASPQLLERFLRCLASNSYIKEVGVNEYQANNTTHILANPNAEAAVYHIFDMNGPNVMAMPDFFAENKYQDVESITNTPFQKAQNTSLDCFEWLKGKPELYKYMQKVMTLLQGSEWTAGFTLLNLEIEKVPSGPPRASEKPFLVDVGGGHGHQCIELGKKYPNLLGRLVLQDLPVIVDSLTPIEGVQIQPHNFFEKQPISGAKFYYLRRIMHDWPDKDCAKILQNIVDVMGADSRILIDDTVIPDTGATWQSTMADISMMITLAGKERTNQQWRALADSVGLRVEEIYAYTASTYTSIVVLSLK